jgi:hypothetical protein
MMSHLTEFRLMTKTVLGLGAVQVSCWEPGSSLELDYCGPLYSFASVTTYTVV